MILAWFFVSAVAVGHLCLLVLVLNTAHAVGMSERATDRLMAIIATFWLGTTAALAWAAWSATWQSWPVPLLAYALLCLATGAVGLPFVTLARLRRRTPTGVSEQIKARDLVSVAAATDLIGTGRHAWMLRLPGNESFQLQRLEWHVEMRGLPPSCDGLSLLHLSDFHFARCFERGFFEAVADEAARGESDLVVFTGDLIDHESTIDWIEPVLSRLRGRFGTFAILGNHDYSFDTGNIHRELRKAGFANLDGRWRRLEIGAASVAIGGTSAPWGPALDLEQHAEADVRIVMSHTPDHFYRVARQGIDLMLAGHNHGGQIRLPIVGPVLMPSRYSRRFDRGFFQSGQTLMYVSQGVAGKHPIRYGCPPEVTRIVLRSPLRRTLVNAAISDDRLRNGSGVHRRPGDLVH